MIERVAPWIPAVRLCVQQVVPLVVDAAAHHGQRGVSHSAFWSALVPILVASWALGGLYLSLGPSVAASLFGLSNHLVGGLVVSLLCGAGALTAFGLRSRPIDRIFRISAILLSAGTALTLAGVELHAVALAGVGTVVAGAGFGSSGLATFGTLGRIAAPSERSELFAVPLVIAYVAFSLPAVAAGFVSTAVGLRPTTLVYSLVVAALGLLALAAEALSEPDGILPPHRWWSAIVAAFDHSAASSVARA